MVAISESAVWGSVTRIEPTTVALGGDEVNSPNLQLKQLVDRTLWLRDNFNVIPVGAIQLFAGFTAPDGYALCEGQDLSIETYPDLFDILGTTYGSSVPGVTFKLPDLRTRVPVGRGTGYDMGDTGGAATHTLTVEEMPIHTHTADNHSHSITDPQHNHVGFMDAESDSVPYISTSIGVAETGIGTALIQPEPEGAVTQTNNASTGISVDSSGITINDAGSGDPHTNMQPYIVLNYIIKT
jgi:microcystin-dependent protein